MMNAITLVAPSKSMIYIAASLVCQSINLANLSLLVCYE